MGAPPDEDITSQLGVPAEAGPHGPQWWLRGADPGALRAAQRLGLTVVRRLERMERPLPLGTERPLPLGTERPLPLGTERPLPLDTERPLPLDDDEPRCVTRAFDAARDSDDWLAVNNAAFDWHPDQGRWSAGRLAERLAEPWVDLDGFLVHDGTDGHLDGFCWTRLHPAEAGGVAVGEIYVIAVHPRCYGSGLGKGLLLAGLHDLHHRQGAQRAMLYVEADNDAARRLYLGFGFAVVATDLAVARVGPT